jgi:hypothetical protein
VTSTSSTTVRRSTPIIRRHTLAPSTPFSSASHRTLDCPKR